MPSKDEARRWTRAGILAAFAIVLSYIETFIPLPLPLPGAKWGLANIAVLMTLVLVDGRCALAITAIKTLVTALLFGTPLMIPYSAAGALLALGGMYGLLKVPGLHLVLISVAGALLHVAGQLAVAALMLGTPLVWYSFPFLMAVACATGVITGKIATALIEAVQDEGAIDPLARAATAALEQQARTSKASSTGAPETLHRPGKSSRFACTSPRFALVLLAGLAAYVVLAFCLQGAMALTAMAAIALGCAAATRISPRDALKALAPLGSILVITTVAHVLYGQQGTAVMALGPVIVTQEALAAAGIMTVRLVCVMLASIAFARIVSEDALLKALEKALAPLERRGLPTAGFLMSCHLALRFIPVLTSSFKQLRSASAQQNPQFGTGGPLSRLRDYQTLIRPLASAAFAYADSSPERLAGDRIEDAIGA